LEKTRKKQPGFSWKSLEKLEVWMGTSSIWVNYNDLTAISLESWLIREIIPNGLNSG
jgi:hypothetical protein